jgi:hypothetical protein
MISCLISIADMAFVKAKKIADYSYSGQVDASGVCQGAGMYEIVEGKSKGDKFVGMFVQGRMCGIGAYVWVSGAFSMGEWQADQKDGVGYSVFSDGTQYVGVYCLGKKSGAGQITLPNNAVYTGEWEGDMQDGEYVYVKIHVCLFVCMYECMYVCMYVCL